MKKFINKFKNLEKTKRIVILYITISFIFILGITFYNAYNNSFENNKDIVTINDKKETLEEETENQQEEIDQDKKVDEENTNSEDNQNDQKVIKENQEIDNTNQKANEENNNDQEEIADNNIDTSINQSNENNISSTEEKNQDNSINIDNENNETDNEKIEKAENSVHIQVIGINETIMSGNLTIDENANAYTVLQELAAQKGIKVTTSGFGKMVYVRGIGDLFEKQYGNLSGWMYKVNGNSPNVGAGSYTLSDGDNIVWYYVNYE